MLISLKLKKNTCTVCKRHHPTSLHRAILERIKKEALMKYKEQEAGKAVRLSKQTMNWGQCTPAKLMGNSWINKCLIKLG